MSGPIHHVPGRLRLRSTMTRSFPGHAEALQERFMALPGVHSTLVSPRTGSLTILYDPNRLDSADLYKAVGVAGPLRSDKAKISGSRGTKLAKAGEIFGKAAFDVFVAKALERSVVSILAALR